MKRTVNFDDPEAYHLYFGDEVDMPGTILTFFPWLFAPRGRPGGNGDYCVVQCSRYLARIEQQPRPTETSTRVYSGAPQNSIDRSPCESIKGKTYLSWNGGTFDNNPNTVNSGQIVFDANGNGTTREFFSEYPTSKSADQLTRTVTCAVYANDSGTLAGKSYLDFGGGAILAITSYDNGSRVWADATHAGRLTKGWMLQLPPDPPPGSNLVK